MRVSVLSFLLLFICFGQAIAQDRQELEKKRTKLLKQINKTNQRLKETKEERKETFENVIVLNNQIQNREQLLQTLESEISLADKSIIRSEEVIEALSYDIQRLQKEYGRNVRRTWRMRQSQPMLLFVLSGESLAQAFRRWHYLRQYDRYRKRQAKLIAETRTVLMQKINMVTQRKTDKAKYAGDIEVQKANLASEKMEKERQVSILKKDEQRLASELSEQQRNKRQLDDGIEDMIIAEMRAKKERAKREAEAAPSTKKKPAKPEKTPSSTTSKPKPEAETVYAPNAEEVALNKSFAANKGRLPQPVNGNIWTKFGKQKHPIVKSVWVENSGIDIESEVGASIRAVFDGEVSNIKAYPGYGYTVLVNHGNYYTVYAMVEAPQVRAGQKISARDVIGTVGSNNLHQRPLMHFEIWKDKTPMNPELWLQ